MLIPPITNWLGLWVFRWGVQPTLGLFSQSLSILKNISFGVLRFTSLKYQLPPASPKRCCSSNPGRREHIPAFRVLKLIWRFFFLVMLGGTTWSGPQLCFRNVLPPTSSLWAPQADLLWSFLELTFSPRVFQPQAAELWDSLPANQEQLSALCSTCISFWIAPFLIIIRIHSRLCHGGRIGTRGRKVLR